MIYDKITFISRLQNIYLLKLRFVIICININDSGEEKKLYCKFQKFISAKSKNCLPNELIGKREKYNVLTSYAKMKAVQDTNSV